MNLNEALIEAQEMLDWARLDNKTGVFIPYVMLEELIYAAWRYQELTD